MTAAEIISLLASLANAQSSLAALFAKAHSEGREVSDAELDSLAHDDDTAQAILDAAIKKARG
jgi:hypothetical protein